MRNYASSALLTNTTILAIGATDNLKAEVFGHEVQISITPVLITWV